MATSQQEMFTPLAPLIRGKLSSPRQGGLRGLLFMSWRKKKNPLKHCMNNCLFSPGLHLRMLNFLLMLYAG